MHRLHACCSRHTQDLGLTAHLQAADNTGLQAADSSNLQGTGGTTQEWHITVPSLDARIRLRSLGATISASDAKTRKLLTDCISSQLPKQPG